MHYRKRNHWIVVDSLVTRDACCHRNKGQVIDDLSSENNFVWTLHMQLQRCVSPESIVVIQAD